MQPELLYVEDRAAWIKVAAVPQPLAPFTLYDVCVRHKRWCWQLLIRFRDIVVLDRTLRYQVAHYAHQRPKRRYWGNLDAEFVEKRCVAIQSYLQSLADDQKIWDNKQFREFLGIGAASFQCKRGRKCKEGYLYKCSGGYRQGFSRRAGDVLRVWRRRWIILFDSSICYFKSNHDTNPRGILHIDQYTICSISGRYITVENGTRSLQLQALSNYEALEWKERFECFYRDSPRRQLHIHRSSFPVRQQSECKYYICGRDFMAAAAAAMLCAKEEIFIAAWWLTPEVYMTRPPLPSLRLDQILKHKATHGVQVYILLYQEINFVMPNASYKTQWALKSMSPNIHIIRHPNKLRGGSTAVLWSHHEKIIVIDQALAFVGGMDLVWGRWDDLRHALTDTSGLRWPRGDYYNPIACFTKTIPPHAHVIRQDCDEPLTSESEDNVECCSSESEGVLSEEHFERMRSDDLPKPLRNHELTQQTASVVTQGAYNMQNDEIDCSNSACGNNAVLEARVGENEYGRFSHWVNLQAAPTGDANLQLRSLIPRMPWHDVHVSISHIAARDVALHFIQRWNHHRTAKSKFKKPVLVPVTDRIDYGICARCGSPVSEYDAVCRCYLHLGEPGACSSISLCNSREVDCEKSMQNLTFLELRCTFEHRLRIRVTGDGPVAVAALLASPAFYAQGTILTCEGPYARELLLRSRGATPDVGDIVIAVDDRDVTAASYEGLESLIKVRPRPVSITFRRYWHSIQEYVAQAGAALMSGQELPSAEWIAEPISNSGSDRMSDELPNVQEHAIGSDSPLKTAMSDELSDSQEHAIGGGDSSDKANQDFGIAFGSEAIRCRVRERVVRESVSKEVIRSIGKLLEQQDVMESIPSKCTQEFAASGCNVQVLRSIGAWSTGAPKEVSIADAYYSAIRSAKHFIYIENQFFISDTCGNEVQNQVCTWLLERVVQAARMLENFRLVVLLPLHPEGDLLQERSVQVVLHYQYRTICRGASSLLEQFKCACPHAAVEKYISFFSLRNWGVLNDKIVTEQVYVHDKVLIVDDSANINDRSLLGDRDSELALQIEDTRTITSSMCGEPFVVGVFVHSLRVDLWRKHTGDPTANVEDPICKSVYEDLWLKRAEHNTHLYELAVDRCASSYRCVITAALHTAMIAHMSSRCKSRAQQLQALTKQTAMPSEDETGEILREVRSRTVSSDASSMITVCDVRR